VSASVHSRAAELVLVAAERDRVAVDDPGDDRRQLTGRHRDHRLVDEAETGFDRSSTDERVALLHQCDRQEIRVPEALADLRDLGRHAERGVVVAREDVLEEVGIRRYPRSTQSDAPRSSSRRPRPNQPAAVAL
jgi:hypothetical protein